MPLVRKPTTQQPSSPPAVEETLRALTSTDTDARWAAARAAGAMPGGIAAIAAVVRTESEPHVREALFSALARAGTTESHDCLIELLRTDQSGLRTGALDALRSIGPGVSALLPRLLADADADVRILSCELARGLDSADATELLCILLAQEREANVCAAAVEVLAEVGTPTAIAVLAQCAQRFGDNTFLGFAIKVACERIATQTALPHG